MRNSILLRKIGGRFDALWSGNGRPASTATSNPDPLFGGLVSGVFGRLCMLMILPLLILGGAFMAMHGVHLPEVAQAHHMAPTGLAFAAAGTTTEVTELMNGIQKAFADMREANDERIKALENRKAVDPLLEAKVDKANDEITRLTNELKAAQSNIREVETLQARHRDAGTSEVREKESINASKFFAMVRGTEMVQASAEEIKQYREYGTAFQAYLRRGEQAINSDLRNALSTGSAPDGGFFLTPDTSGRIIEIVFQTSVLRDMVSVQSIGTDTLEGVNDLDEVSSGWVGEMSSRPETNTPPLAASKWQIPVQEQYANPKTTQKMLDDSQFDVEGWLAKKVAAKLGRVENTAFVNGNGVSKPRGFMTYPAASGKQSATNWKVISQIGTGVSGAFSTKPGDCFVDLITALKVELRGGAMFGMNSATLGAVRKLTDTQNRYLLIPDFSNSPNGTLLGYGIRELQDMPDIAASALPIAFANWKEAYQIVDHVVGLRTLRDPFTAKPFVQFYTTKRTGGDVLNFEAIKLMKLA